MDLECRFCTAKHFEFEVTLGDRTSFTSCCHKGKTIFPLLSQNEYFKSLYDELILNEPSTKVNQKIILKIFANTMHHLLWLTQKLKFLKQLQVECIISKYMMFLSHIGSNDIWAFISAYGLSPCFAQLYFYDVDTAISYGLQERFNQTVTIT